MMEVDQFENGNGRTSSLASDEDMFGDSPEKNGGIEVKASSSSGPSCSSIQDTLEHPVPHTSIKEGVKWRGTPISKLPRNLGDVLYPHVSVSPRHTVLFKLPVKSGKVSKPWPEKPVDVWDQKHVRMPHSAHSLYPVTPTELRRRWDLVKQSLRSPITTSHQLEAAILHYNSKYSDRWNFQALHTFFSQVLEDVESEYFFSKVLPQIIELALALPLLVTNGVPLLTRHSSHSISLTQQQVSSLLANAFLCTFPRRNTAKKNSEYSGYPDINFNRLFNGERAEAKGRINSLHEKLKCLINYFRRVTTKVPEGVITFTRHYVPPNGLPVWRDQSATLLNLHVTDEGTIEDGGTGMLEMDFANKFVGGGVLGCGCVQEEIRFVTYPELIVARLFTEALDDTEALIIKGCERFNKYEGYANSFEWAGNSEDPTPRDNYSRLCCTVVAVDALRFPNTKAQYTPDLINRELNKAYAGLSCGAKEGSEESVATGNWGCGAFRGDVQLKALLQLMAAAVTGRQLAYFTFGNADLRDSLADMHSFLVHRQVSVGDLWKVITSYSHSKYCSLYDHIYSSIRGESEPVLKCYRPSPKEIKKMKFLKKKETKEIDERRKISEDKISHKLSAEEIEATLDEEILIDNSDSPKPIEARTLSLQQNKDLCIKRLSSSWTNLNDSKKDFKPIKNTSNPTEDKAETSFTGQHYRDQKQNSISRKKKTISDYFQPAPKS